VSDLDTVETERMVAERMRPRHQRELSVLLRDPRVARTLWPGEPVPTEGLLLHILADKLDHWERHGFGLWLLRDRATGAMVGRGGLQHTVVGRYGEVEAGWAIVPERWGEGLATELAHLCLEVAFGELELAQVIAMALPTNVASRRVMEKSGFAHERVLLYRGLAHVLYRAVSSDGPGDPKRVVPSK
jgi:RimJ/RimL family protein N-acetyltransferase